MALPWNVHCFLGEMKHRAHKQEQQRPKCKAKDCLKEVYSDGVVGNFDYCSPTCRNKDLLQDYTTKLKADIAEISRVHGTRL